MIKFYRKVRDFHLELFKDERDAISIKPVTAWICTWFLCISLAINIFKPSVIAISDALVDAVMIIALVGLGADSVDKFSLKRSRHKPEEEEEPQQLNG